jgi:type II pantothenate kinase
MSHFCLLKAPDSYVPVTLDLVDDKKARHHWLDVFARQFEQMLEHASVRYGRTAAKRVAGAREEFLGLLDRLRDDPSAAPSGRLSIVEVDHLRESTLRKHALGDPYGHAKDQHNVQAAELYPQVVHALHALDREDRWLCLLQGVLAGNLFDLGASETMDQGKESRDFLAALADVPPRPWLVDDYDLLAESLLAGPPVKWSKAVLFLDNAGSDLILGAIPLARELALAGTVVVLAANELPSLNDVTADEAVQVIQRLAAQDDDLAALIQAGMFEVVSTGSDIPLLDLSDVSDELNESAADAELIILEGMGRSVESNYDAEFRVDALRLAVLKDPDVAQRVGGEVFDCICKYTPIDAA